MNEQTISPLRAWCEEHAQEHKALLRTLAAIPSPSHHEDLRAAFITKWLLEHGIGHACTDEAKNVILPLNCEGRTDISVFAAHTDVVFPDLEPLPVREENGLLYAPGVGDDTANVAALMLCALYLKDHPTAAPMLICFNSCEEGLGNLKGVRALFEAYAGRIRSFVSFDGQYSGLVCRAVGSERWRVSVRTRGGHSYGAFGNPNAIALLSRLIASLYSQKIPEYENAKTTYNVGTISGGTSVNTIAQDAEMTYEYRSDDRDALKAMRLRFHELLKEHRADDASWDAQLIGERPCGEALDQAAEKALLDRCSRVIESVTGAAPRLRSSSTDCNIPFSLGVPATSFGLYLGQGAHTREEYVRLDTLTPGLEIALTLLTRVSWPLP